MAWLNSLAGVSADAVGNHQQVAHRDAHMEDGVLILFAQDSAVAFFSEQNNWLRRDQYLFHT